ELDFRFRSKLLEKPRAFAVGKFARNLQAFQSDRGAKVEVERAIDHSESTLCDDFIDAERAGNRVAYEFESVLPAHDVRPEGQLLWSGSIGRLTFLPRRRNGEG